MDNGGGKLQPQSAGRIRERFLSKIGIEAPPLPPPPGKLPTITDNAKAEASAVAAPPSAKGNDDGSSASATPPPPPPTACLGGVRPMYEPLKVCLDDDTSDEEGGDFGDDEDDDYFVGIGDEDIEGLFKKRVCVGPPGPPTAAPLTTSPLVQLPSREPEESPSKGAATEPLLEAAAAAAAAAAVSSDEGSALSEASSTRTSASSLPAIADNLSRSMHSHDSLSSKSQGTKRKRSRRRVSLKTDVAIVPIPRREEYSDRIRERLWSSAAELYQNAARNAVEFASEGWNWRNVTEDEDMLVHNVSGELIHPVHLQNVMQMNAESGEPPLQIPLRPNRPGSTLLDVAKGSGAAAKVPQQQPKLPPA